MEILGYSRIYHLARIHFPAGYVYCERGVSGCVDFTSLAGDPMGSGGLHNSSAEGRAVDLPFNFSFRSTLPNGFTSLIWERIVSTGQ